MNNVTLTVIEWNSSRYLRCLTLRNEQLRRDEGLEDLLIAPEEEARCVHLAAIADGEVVGTMHLEPVDSGEVAVKQVVIAKSYRGHGIGAKMMAFSERVAAEMGYRVITLNGKVEAWGFYERLGFIACGVERAWLATVVKPYRKTIGPGRPAIPAFQPQPTSQRGRTRRSQLDDLRRDDAGMVREHARYRRPAHTARV